jgi:pyruvate formate lyase activating enzyme
LPTGPARRFGFTNLAVFFRARDRRGGSILRICWETNGAMNPRLLDRMMELAVESGGCLKFDLKAWDPVLHRVLTGAANARTLENFVRAAGWIGRRPVPPVLMATTLMVPGYIDEREIQGIARFIAGLNPDIPYSLLAFSSAIPHGRLAGDAAVPCPSLPGRRPPSRLEAGIHRE